MRQLFTRLLAPLAAALLLAGSPARADFLYSWDLTNPSPVLNATSGGGNVSVAVSQPGTGGPFIPAASISTNTSDTTPDRFTNVPYGLTVQLTDSASNKSGNLTFNGLINGTLTTTSSTLTSTFASPLTQTLTLGGNVYTVTIEPSPASIGVPTAPPTLIDAQVSVSASSGGGTGGTGGGGPQNTPEPSSFVLGVLALAAVGGWRRCRAWIA